MIPFHLKPIGIRTIGRVNNGSISSSNKALPMMETLITRFLKGKGFEATLAEAQIIAHLIELGYEVEL